MEGFSFEPKGEEAYRKALNGQLSSPFAHQALKILSVKLPKLLAQPGPQQMPGITDPSASPALSGLASLYRG